MLSVVILTVIMLSAVMPSRVMLNVIMPCIIMQLSATTHNGVIVILTVFMLCRYAVADPLWFSSKV